MIALRARREATQVAQSIQNSPMEVERPAAVTSRPASWGSPAQERRESLAARVSEPPESLVGRIIAFVIFYLLLLLVLWTVTDPH